MGKEKRVPLLVGASGLGASHLLLGGLNLLLFLLKEASKTILRGLHGGERLATPWREDAPTRETKPFIHRNIPSLQRKRNNTRKTIAFCFFRPFKGTAESSKRLTAGRHRSSTTVVNSRVRVCEVWNEQEDEGKRWAGGYGKRVRVML